MWNKKFQYNLIILTQLHKIFLFKQAGNLISRKLGWLWLILMQSIFMWENTWRSERICEETLFPKIQDIISRLHVRWSCGFPDQGLIWLQDWTELLQFTLLSFSKHSSMKVTLIVCGGIQWLPLFRKTLFESYKW